MPISIRHEIYKSIKATVAKFRQEVMNSSGVIERDWILKSV